MSENGLVHVLVILQLTKTTLLNYYYYLYYQVLSPQSLKAISLPRYTSWNSMGSMGKTRTHVREPLCGFRCSFSQVGPSVITALPDCLNDSLVSPGFLSGCIPSHWGHTVLFWFSRVWAHPSSVPCPESLCLWDRQSDYYNGIFFPRLASFNLKKTPSDSLLLPSCPWKSL